MTHHEIVKKLIGPINPVGKSEVDQERLENLNKLCDLVEMLLMDIDDARHEGEGRYESSMKLIGNRAGEFINNHTITFL